MGGTFYPNQPEENYKTIDERELISGNGQSHRVNIIKKATATSVRNNTKTFAIGRYQSAWFDRQYLLIDLDKNIKVHDYFFKLDDVEYLFENFLIDFQSKIAVPLVESSY